MFKNRTVEAFLFISLGSILANAAASERFAPFQAQMQDHLRLRKMIPDVSKLGRSQRA